MAEHKLRPAPGSESKDSISANFKSLNRRQFLTYGFGAAAGVLAASVGALGFASLLMPGGGGSGGDTEVKYWAKGREDTAWYGAMHLQGMKKSDFVAEAEKSATGMSGAQGVWNGLPVNVTFVPHSANAGTPLVSNKPRFQLLEGYDATGKYIGHFEDMVDMDARIMPSEDIIMVFSRCPHLCCIPGWQLVENSLTEDSWASGGGDGGGSKLFCICHSSRFDPTALEANTNRNRSNGTTYTYAGIRRTGGPAPVGLPIIPVAINADAIEGIPDYLDWLTYCD